MLLKAVLFTVVGILGVATALVPGFQGFSAGGVLVAIFLIDWLYGVGFEWALGGRTPGKMVVGLRVVRTDGSPASFDAYFLRNLLRGVDVLPGLYLVGVFTQLMDSKLRRIGDLVGGTVVVREQSTWLLDGVQITPPITEQERRDLPASVHLSREEQTLIADLLRRRTRLGPGLSRQLAEDLADRLAEDEGVHASDPMRVLTLAWARSTGRDRDPS